MKRQMNEGSRCRRLSPYKKRTRYPKVWLRKDVFEKWSRIALICHGTEKLLTENIIKQTELLYANAVSGEITMLLHFSGLTTLLTPVFLLCKVFPLENDKCPLKCTRLKVSPEAYARAQAVAYHFGLPMSVVFAAAINFAATVSDPSVVGIKTTKHPSFPPK